jgi:hypothetical protein
MRLLGRWPCIRIERIEIKRDQRVYIMGSQLSPDERDALAWRDGFRADGGATPFEQMMEFWAGRLPFTGQIIHREFKRPVTKEWPRCDLMRRIDRPGNAGLDT